MLRRNGTLLWQAGATGNVTQACTLSIQTNGRLLVSGSSTGTVLWSNDVLAPGSGPFTLTLTGGRLVETDNAGVTK